MVLSGGGSKGVAHAGVLKFLEEQNILPEIFSCCSAGSIVATLYAAGKKPEEILEFFKSVYFFHWRHFIINQPGLVSSKVFRNYLSPVFGEKTLGELPISVKIVATELISGKEIIFSEDTKIMDAIISSCSVPGITTPYLVDGNMFSDGGVLNNFPADIIREDCEKLIGVYVSPPLDVEQKDLGTIKSVLSRAYELLSYRVEKYKFGYCDWFITSKELSSFGMFERKTDRLNEIFQIGYESAKKSFEEKRWVAEKLEKSGSFQ